MYSYAEEYSNRNYNVLLPDNCAHGNSQGSFIGMGYLDQFDIFEWINYIVSIDDNAEILLHGVSMGAAMQPGDVPVTYADTEALERDYGFKPAPPSYWSAQVC